MSGGSAELSQVVNACRFLLQSPGYLGCMELAFARKGQGHLLFPHV